MRCPYPYPISEEQMKALPPWAMLVKIAFPALDIAEDKMMSSQAMLHAALTSVEIERYFLKNNKLPNDLGDLELGQAIYLKDPFSGEPLKYRREGEDNYQLYSVSINRVDDGGVQGMTRERPDRKKGDLLWWRLPLPEEEESEE